MKTIERINKILKSRFCDGGMPFPKYSVSGKMLNRSQIIRCITNTWKSLNGDGSVMICIDNNEEVTDTDSLIWMNRLLTLTDECSIKDIDDIIKNVMNNYFELMKDTQSRFFLASVHIRYQKLFKEEIEHDIPNHVTIYKRRKRFLSFKR